MPAPTYAGTITAAQTLPTWQKITNQNQGVGTKWEGDLKRAKAKKMKRLNNIFQKIISLENLHLADKKARKGKGFRYGIQLHDKTRVENIKALHESLKNKTYKTSPYTTFLIKDPKEREVFRLPYFPNRYIFY